MKLLAEFGDDEEFKKVHIATYVIGAPLTEEYLAEHQYLKAAKGKKDLGVIISFNALDPKAEYTGKKLVSINPLNWKTSSKKADASLNKGYASYNTYGDLVAKIDNYCGAYIDEKTGTLRVTDIENQDELFETETGFFIKGDYHLNDLVFFCKNLSSNVSARIKKYNSTFKPSN